MGTISFSCGCCIETDSSCSHCDTAKTPKNVTVTFTGITNASCCVTGTFPFWKTAVGTFNGVFTMTSANKDGICNWRKTLTTTTFRLDSYGGATCIARISTEDVQLVYQLGAVTSGGTTYDVLALLSASSGLYIFVSYVPTNTNCTATRNFTAWGQSCGSSLDPNDPAATTPGSFSIAGWGGTATVVAS